MKSSMADKLFLCCVIAAVPATAYAVFDFFSILHQIKNGLNPICFDTETGYYVLASIFFPLFIIRSAAGNNKNSIRFIHMKWIVVLWFIGCLGIAGLWPCYLPRILEKTGYTRCNAHGPIPMISEGRRLVFVRGDCKSIDIRSFNK